MFTHLVRNGAPKCAATMLVGLFAGGSVAAPDPAQVVALHQASIEELKVTYLNCSREALAGRLGQGTIMGCSMVYEALKERAFGGDFSRLLAWSRAHEIAPGGPPRTAATRP